MPCPDAPDQITIQATGKPCTKGSMMAFNDPKGRARLAPSSGRALREWTAEVRSEAKKAMKAYGGAWHDDCLLEVTFRFERPKAHYGTGSNERVLKEHAPYRPTSKTGGDIDKLCRAVLDAIAQVVYKDDAQVVELFARKVYSCRFGGSPGALLVVTAVESSTNRASMASG